MPFLLKVKHEFFYFQFLQSVTKFYEDPLKWYQVHEAQLPIVGYWTCQILGVVGN
jgi:hypothetical protein